jgi:uncharacterized RDD family membrane protein YckC
MHVPMNAIAHSSSGPASGPHLDNRRVAAGLIDLAIVVAGTLVIGLVAGLYDGGAPAVSLPVVAVMTGWALYYYFACESGGGQTLGKKLMKLRVVRVDGSPAGMREIAVRTLVRVLDMQFAYLVGLIAMLATGKRRGRLGDLAAGTAVVSADGPAPAARGGAPAAPAVPELRPFEPVAPSEAAPQETVAPGVQPPDAAVAQPASPVPDDVAAEPTFAGDDLELDPLDDDPLEDDEPREDDEPHVVVKSVETVSAIDLVMNEDEPAPDERDDR